MDADFISTVIVKKSPSDREFHNRLYFEYAHVLIERGFDAAIRVRMAELGFLDVYTVSISGLIEFKGKSYNMFLVTLAARGEKAVAVGEYSVDVPSCRGYHLKSTPTGEDVQEDYLIDIIEQHPYPSTTKESKMRRLAKITDLFNVQYSNKSEERSKDQTLVRVDNYDREDAISLKFGPTYTTLKKH
jgi:hypothetical protein